MILFFNVYIIVIITVLSKKMQPVSLIVILIKMLQAIVLLKMMLIVSVQVSFQTSLLFEIASEQISQKLFHEKENKMSTCGLM